MSSALPVKTRDIHNHHLDSTKWNEVTFRDDDIIAATSYKSGTTWLLATIEALVYQGRERPDNSNHAQGAWIDLRFPPIQVQLPLIESVKDRRYYKTHLRLDCLNYSPNAKYVVICRDGRDVYMSLLNHYKTVNENWYKALSSPGLIGDPIPVFSESYPSGSFFDDWISKGWPSNQDETDGYPFWSTLEFVRTWWEYRHVPNILIVHYSDMLKDTNESVRKIAAFLDIPIIEDGFDALIESLSFDSMKKNADAVSYIPGHLFEGGNPAFFNKGTNGRWKDVLTPEQQQKYIEVASKKLSPDCYKWLESGTFGSGIDPKTV